MRQKPIDLRGAETTLRLQHQADCGRRRRLQTIQTVLNDVDGLMGQNIQLKPWLIAQPLRQTETVHAHVVSGTLEPVFCIVCQASIALCLSIRRRVIGSGGRGGTQL